MVAPPREEPAGEIDPDSIAVRTFTAPTMSVKATTTPEWRAADLGALNGHSNARGVLDVMRVLSLGGSAGGVQLLSPSTIETVFRQQSDGVDLVLEAPFRWGIGYCLGSDVVPYVPSGRTFFWGGWGGSLVVMDLDRRLTISYMMNAMAPGILGVGPQRGLRAGGLRGARLIPRPCRRGAQTSHGFGVSSRVGVELGPGGVLAIGGAGLQAAVEDADEAVAELSQCGVMAGAAGAESVVVGAGAG